MISSAASPSAVQTRSPVKTRRESTDRPSTTKATISAIPASAPAKCSISRLYGARSSPMRMPARKTARKPEPSQRGRGAVEQHREGDRLHRVERLVGQRDTAHDLQQQPAAGDADRGADRQLQREVPDPAADARPQPPPAAPSRLTISAMPTGSLAPDSPSSRVPERPAISRRPRTENTTAGSVGASAAPMSSAGAPVEAEDQVGAERQRAGGDHRAGDAEPEHGARGGAHPGPADVHAAVEQDDRQRDGHDALVGDDRQGAQPREQVRRRWRRRRGTAPAPERGSTARAVPSRWPRGWPRP